MWHKLVSQITPLFLGSLLMFPLTVQSRGVGTSGGASLNISNGARPAGLADAFSASSNDIAGFGFNPATLSLLKTHHADFVFQRGSIEDNFGRIAFGMPHRSGGLGVAVGAYDSGELAVSNDGFTQRTVTAQRDLFVSVGTSLLIKGVSFGVAGKILNSELVEAETARAYAGDFGLSLPVSSRVRVGSAIQNIGSNLKFRRESDELPRVFRSGISFLLIPARYITTLSVEAPYFMNEKEWRPAAGVETKFGPLALRAGYKTGTDLEEFSIGTGFLFGVSSFDYAFGLVDELESRHRISYSMRFGRGINQPELVKKEEDDRLVYEIDLSTDPYAQAKIAEAKDVEAVAGAAPLVPPGANLSPANLTKPKEVRKPDSVVTPQKKETKSSPAVVATPSATCEEDNYFVRKGDTLWGISKYWFRNNFRWPEIHQFNRSLISNPDLIYPNQEFQLPRRQYVVKKGDSLSKLSRRWYGKTKTWPKIQELNQSQISNPNFIKVGQVICVPGGE